MSKIQQQIADTQEYAKLISEITILSADELKNVGQKVDDLGVSTLKVNNVADTLQEGSKITLESLEQLTNLEEKTNEQLDQMGQQMEIVNNTLLENNNSSELLAESILLVNTTLEDGHAKVIEQLQADQSEYSEKADQAVNAVTDLISFAESINHAEDFKDLNEHIRVTNDHLVDLSEKQEQQQNELKDLLTELAAGLVESNKNINQLAEELSDITSDMKIAVAKTNAIETQIDLLQLNNQDSNDELESLKALSENL